MRIISAGSRRPSLHDRDRLSQWHAAKLRSTGSRTLPHTGSMPRKFKVANWQCGYLTPGSTIGSRPERNGSLLFNIWRMWNYTQSLPATFFRRRGNGLPSYQVWVDLSTLLIPIAFVPLNSPYIAEMVNWVHNVTSPNRSFHGDTREEYVFGLDHNEAFIPRYVRT